MYTMIVFSAQALPEGRVFGLDTQTLIGIGIQLLNGIILAVALGFILYKPVKEFMQRRTERIRSKINEADAAMAKANELIAEYERKIKEINKERLAILEAANLEVAEERKRILDEARKEADEIRKRALEKIAEDKKHLEKETRLYIIEVASLMAQKYIAQSMDAETQERLFEEALAQLEAAQWQN
ncbi:MAG TPA: ATP synthase F0 subunit B [Firmicutes bacterium]|nr:ATP synthase F0 subunit B [Bacillota bacterium]